MSETAVKPLSSFYSTNLNPIVNSYERLATRIAHTLGYPQINIEAHQNQVYENISIAIEMFTKFAGYTEEFLVFNSKLYPGGNPGGLRMDVLFTASDQFDYAFPDDPQNTKLDTDLYEIGHARIGGKPIDFAVSYPKVTTQTYPNSGSQEATQPQPNMNSYDYLTDSYRKVVDVFAFEEGSSSGINTLFTIEQTLAQQTYFSYAMGKYGFDLISWYTLKNWLDTRRKLLSQDYYFKFDDRKQMLHITPTPGGANRTNFYGVVGCYVEKPVYDLVKEPWVYQYALALTKINISRIRGKYSGTNLFGGGAPNYTELLSEGNEAVKELETKLYEGAPGFGDNAPPLFFVG
tara:strand:+ start:777 stop:1817 length:1041 start_codon:yes stop_codon:yes gene_type:complete